MKPKTVISTAHISEEVSELETLRYELVSAEEAISKQFSSINGYSQLESKEYFTSTPIERNSLNSGTTINSLNRQNGLSTPSPRQQQKPRKKKEINITESQSQTRIHYGMILLIGPLLQQVFVITNRKTLMIVSITCTNLMVHVLVIIAMFLTQKTL